MKTVRRVFGIVLLLLSLVNCGGGGGGNSSNNNSTTTANLSGTVQADPGDPTASGKNVGATVYVIGQQNNATTTDGNGNFNLNVDATLSGTVLSSPSWFTSLFKKAGSVTKTFGLVVISAGNTHGKKTEISTTDGTVNPISTIYINTVGSISGKAYLQGQTDHTGIRVYIPGTSFQATTDASGNYTISSVPSGTYDLVRADYPGTTYGYAMVSNVTVATTSDTRLTDMLLMLSPGASGKIMINAGDAFATSQTVTVSIAPSPTAVQMMISEDVNFLGVQWEPVQPTKVYTFSGNFDGGKTATLYAKFQEASGSATTASPTAIYIDTNPLAGAVSPLNGGVIASTKPSFNWLYAPVTPMPNLSYRIQLTTATDSGFAATLADFTTAVNTTHYAYSGAPLNQLGNYIWRVAIIDGANKQWNWSGPWSFSIDLSTVTLTAPANLSYVNKATNNSGVMFTWQENLNADSYVLAVCYDDTTVSCGTTFTVTAPATSKTIPPITTADGKYYWTVTPKDVNGVTGTRSSVYSFTLDTTGPTVTATVPNDTATGVSKFALITATFSEPLTLSSLSTSDFTLYSVSTGTAAGFVAYDAATYEATFTPLQLLMPGTLYDVAITTAVTDIAGNPLQASKVWSFTTSTTGSSVYWIESGLSGAIVEVGFSGGTPGVLASGLPNPDSSHIVVDSTNVYWMEYPGTGSLMRMPIIGGPTTTLASGLANVRGIAVDATNVYWTEYSSGTVKKVAISGGPTTTLVSGRSNPTNIAADSSNVYWTEWGTNGLDGAVMKVPVNSGPTTTLAFGQSNLNYGFAIDSTTVYWTESNSGGTVKSVLKSGGTVTILASGLDNPLCIAVDSANVYWTEFVSGTVKSVPKSGGMTTTLASGQNNPVGITVGSTNVFWTENTSSGTLKSIPISGGTVTALVTGLSYPSTIAIGP